MKPIPPGLQSALDDLRGLRHHLASLIAQVERLPLNLTPLERSALEISLVRVRAHVTQLEESVVAAFRREHLTAAEAAPMLRHMRSYDDWHWLGSRLSVKQTLNASWPRTPGAPGPELLNLPVCAFSCRVGLLPAIRAHHLLRCGRRPIWAASTESLEGS